MAATAKQAARVLGLTLATTPEDVRRVRKEMAMKYHPDRARDQDEATRHMARINAAADTLIAHLNENSEGQKTSRQDRAARDRRTAARPSKAAQQKTQRKKTAPKAARADTGQSLKEVIPTCHLSAYASAAYKTVLQQIGGGRDLNMVDVRIMRFSA